MANTLTIGKLAELTEISAKTIRFYEQTGILPLPERNDSHYRLYSEIDVKRLLFIRQARILDMDLPEVRDLVQWASTETCGEFQDRFREVVGSKLKEVESRIKDLRSLKKSLTHLEAHLSLEPESGACGEHSMLDCCPPDTCACLGASEPTIQKKGGRRHD